MPLAVAKRYAQALGEVITKPGSKLDPESVLDQLKSFHSLLQTSEELNNVLLSPAVSVAKKRAIIAAIGRKLEYDTALQNFLYVVIDHRRLGMLNEMVEALRSWLDDHVGIARVDVISALPVPNDQREKIIETFRRMTGREVLAQFSEDPSILGGVVVKHGSRLYDGSLKAQLRALDQAIAQHA